MHAQTLWFDGPRSAELIAAAERAGVERIEPAVRSDAEAMAGLVAMIVLRRPDGGELVVTIGRDEQSLRRHGAIVMGTTLLPGEDPALLPGPDRVEFYEVVHTVVGGTPLG